MWIDLSSWRMNFFHKSSFTWVFLLTFCITLFILSIQKVVFYAFFDVWNQYKDSIKTMIGAHNSGEKFWDIRVRIWVDDTRKQKIVVNLWDRSIEKSHYNARYQPESVQTISKSPKQPKIVIQPKTSFVPKGYIDTVKAVLLSQYFFHTLWDFPISIDTKRTSPRWQMLNESLILSASIKTFPELAKVLVHELGHMIDIHVLSGRKWWESISREFYDISWLNQSSIRSDANKEDFISGYAATNQYEDFSESFAMYIFHNRSFYERWLSSPNLMKKYMFLKEKVFWEYFYDSGDHQELIVHYFWDVTKLKITSEELKKLFI